MIQQGSMVTCIDESPHAEGLTWGKRYALVEYERFAHGDEVRIVNDNGREVGYPVAAFDLSGGDAPAIVAYELDPIISQAEDVESHVMAPTTEVLKLWLGRSLLGIPML